MAKEYLSANPPYVVVVKGDTLSEIAEKYGKMGKIPSTNQTTYGKGGWLEKLADLNDITNTNIIVVGQKIILSGNAVKKTNSTSTPVVKAFGLQSNTDRTMYATWTWTKSNTENYRIIWYYDTGNGVWFIGNDSTTTDKQCTYGAPQNAIKVRFKVLPVSKKRKVNNKETSYWTASWSAYKTYEFKNNPPTTPSVSSSNVKIDGNNKLTIEMSNLDTSVDGLNASTIQFQIYQNSTKLVHTGKANISAIGYLTYSWQGKAGYKYTVRCRSVRGGAYSDWSDFTDNICSMPAKPARIIDCYPSDDTSIYITWAGVNSAVTYTIQYIELPNDISDVTLEPGTTYFDRFESSIKTKEVTPYIAGTAPPTNTYISDLISGRKYCFRVRANGSGDGVVSAWTDIREVTLGTTPNAPTTWSSATQVMVGDELTLYWQHNSSDNSPPSQAYVYFDILFADGTISHYAHHVSYDGSEDGGTVQEEVKNENGVMEKVKEGFEYIKGMFTTSASDNSAEASDEDSSVVSKYVIQTANFSEGATVRWSVATKGAGDGTGFGPTSVIREFDIYDVPSVHIDCTRYDNVDIATDEDLDLIFNSFPIGFDVRLESSMQKPIGYHISIISTERYSTVNDVGDSKIVGANETIYSKYYDTDANPLSEELSAGEVDLSNNVKYNLVCSVAMDSGMSIEQTVSFRVFWDETRYEPDAEILIDEESLTASIRPYCVDDENNLLEGVLLSVYRREFDGGFVEISRDVPNTDATFVTDPHPSLDYARYRVVARDESTGTVSYYDVPGYPVDEKSVVLQWDEEWTNFDTAGIDDEDLANELEASSWSGSILKLPYNVDVSDSNSIEVEHIQYIGRRHPVSYYGTHVGQTASWTVEIPKSDKDTLYALRRLSVWMGDVYVREPSGSGYWATISVSFNQTHREVTIPVTLSITRVEGGV